MNQEAQRSQETLDYISTYLNDKSANKLFSKWCKSHGISVPTMLEAKEYEIGDTSGETYLDEVPNLFYAVYQLALETPHLSSFEEAVAPLEFTFQKLGTTDVYTNAYTRQAWELWQVICGYVETQAEGRFEEPLTNNTAEVLNHD